MFRHLYNRITSSQTILFSLLAVLVGLLSGVGVWLFKFLIDQLRGWSF